MAKSPSKRAAIRTLIALVIVVGLMSAALIAGIIQKKASATPSLALDLEGGTQMILRPLADPNAGGRETVSENDLKEAIEVIRQRVDASGVAESEITSLGGRNIVVSLPGHPSEETLDLVRQSAQLVFRPVLKAEPSVAQAELMGQMTEESLKDLDDEQKEAAKKQIAEAKDNPDSYAMKQADADGDGKLSDEPTTQPTDGSDLAWLTEKVNYDLLTLDCTKKENLKPGIVADPKKPLVTCEKDGSAKYALGPVELEGTHVTAADSGLKQTQTGGTTTEWVVNLSFDSKGTEVFSNISERLFAFRVDEKSGQQDPRNRFAIVLDGLVISAPGIENPINNGHAMIDGSFTKESSATLANQLKFGSLPLNFEVQSQQQVSATLGSDQLRYGIIAGIIGMVLIVLFMLWEYRGLSVISVGSLVVAGGLAYLIIALLSWLMGYRLSLAGVAGIIISIGTTADSFIVYFERIRDEVRDGRPLRAAVDEGWVRAKRTILSADAMNLIAAGVLYFLAVGNVQGFAFTLGVMTVIDLIVIFMFTHPLLVLLVRTKFYGEGHRLSGLDPEHLGASTSATYRYKGRGRFEREEVRKEKSINLRAGLGDEGDIQADDALSDAAEAATDTDKDADNHGDTLPHSKKGKAQKAEAASEGSDAK